MNPTGFLKSYLTENELREFVISNKYLDNHTEIIQILSLETHYFTILKRLFRVYGIIIIYYIIIIVL